MRKRDLAILAFGLVLMVSVSAYEASQLITPLLQANSSGSVAANVELHMLVQQYRKGVLISETYHAMTLTTAGKDWIADNLFNSAGTNVTKFAMYIGVSTDDTAVDVAWGALPSEITTNGLGRALAAWTDTGTGTGTLIKSFSITGTESSNLYGLYYETYANAAASTLVAAEQQGSGNQKNMINGDTLAVTITCTCS